MGGRREGGCGRLRVGRCRLRSSGLRGGLGWRGMGIGGMRRRRGGRGCRGSASGRSCQFLPVSLLRPRYHHPFVQPDDCRYNEGKKYR